MRTRKVVNHGQIRYLVEIRKSEGGRRLRKFFATREAADAFHRAHRDSLLDTNVVVAAAFWNDPPQSITPS